MYIDPINPVHEGERVSVTCNIFLIIKQNDNLKWTLNGSAANTNNTDIKFQLIRAEKRGIMTLLNISVGLNNTAVVCAATSPDKEVSSNISIIYVEGKFSLINIMF